MYRIGIDAHMLGDRSGGNESYYSNILDHMEASEGYQLYLFVKREVDASRYQGKFEIITLKEKHPFMRNFYELPSLCRKYHLDLMHTQYFIPFDRPCPVVCTIHDICFEHYKNIFTKKEYYTQKMLIPYAAKNSACVFTVSSHAKQDIQEHYSIPEDKVIVTYNATDPSFRKLTSSELMVEELKKKFEIKANRYILSVGNLQPRKNLVRLIRAFIKLKKTEPEIQLVLVGKKAWMYDEILKAAIEGSEDIIFTDYVDQEELVRLYNGAELFVYPSFFEGFGIPPLEAMACGVPVVVANATSLPEVVGDAGSYFDPFDIDSILESIKKMLYDRELRERSIERGYERVKAFAWERSSRIIMDTYQQILNKR